MWSLEGSQKSALPPSSPLLLCLHCRAAEAGEGFCCVFHSIVRSAAVFKHDDHSQMEGAIVPRLMLGSCLMKKTNYIQSAYSSAVSATVEQR